MKKIAAQHVAMSADVQLSAQVPTTVPPMLRVHMPSAHEVVKTVDRWAVYSVRALP